MAGKKRGLGRGLDALLGGLDNKSSELDADLRQLPVDLIRPGRYQPRIDIHQETLEDLANSIRAQGVIQPIVVRPVGDGQYEIIAGERRWRAAQLADLHEIPAVIRDVPDQAAIAMALIENIQRENLNPMEEAMALQRLVDEFEMTHQQASEAVGRSRTAVTNLLRLLTLEEEVKQFAQNGLLEMGHARALLSLSGAKQVQVAKDVISRQLSVRETEGLVRKISEPSKKNPKATETIDPDIRKFQDDLAERIGAKVAIQHQDKGNGKLVVHYNNLDELEGILAHIK
ncbi:MAG: ParB/RepB/Spo0J family partition protein [Gammaproteobacteria bacterium]|nr:ParB/RepB/Spo0J family partition protein [Gammaproteobacteria bacterium]